MRKNEVHPEKGENTRNKHHPPKKSDDKAVENVQKSPTTNIAKEGENRSGHDDAGDPRSSAADTNDEHGGQHKRIRRKSVNEAAADGHPKKHSKEAQGHEPENTAAFNNEATDQTVNEPPKPAGHGARRHSVLTSDPEDHNKKHSASSDNKDAPKQRRKSVSSDHEDHEKKKGSKGRAEPNENVPTESALRPKPHKKHPKNHKESTDLNQQAKKQTATHKDEVSPENKVADNEPTNLQQTSTSAEGSLLLLKQTADFGEKNKKPQPQNLGPIPLFLPKIKAGSAEARNNNQKNYPKALSWPRALERLASHADITPKLFYQDPFWRPDPAVHVNATVIEHNATAESNLPPEHQDIPSGLEFLEETREFNVFMRPQQLDCDNFEVLLSSFNVLNERGETIYFIAENQKRCYCYSPWSHFLPIYSVTGDLIMVVLKRNTSWCNIHSKQQKKMKEMKLVLRADYYLDGKARREDEATPSYHIYMPSKGTFVGHFVENMPSLENDNPVYSYKFNLYDGNYNILHFVDKTKPEKKAQIQEGDVFDPERVPYFQIFRGHLQCGIMHSRADFRKLGIKAAPEVCYHAEFPPELPPVNKAVILGFMAVTQLETVPVEQDCCTACCIITCCGGSCTVC